MERAEDSLHDDPLSVGSGIPKEIAEDWYLQLRAKLRSGEIKPEDPFREVSAQV